MAAVPSVSIGAVGVLHRELADALEHRVDFVQRAFTDLDHRDPVLGVAHGLVEAADLAAELLADDEAGCVVGCAVDAQAARELLDALAERRRR